MIATGRSLHGPSRDGSELLSIAERARYLLVLRLVLAAAVVGFGASGLVPIAPGASLAIGALAYVALVAAAELLGRRSDTVVLPLARGVLLLDGIFLAWAVAVSGAATSPIRFLAFAHVLAVTVLFSYRSGLKITMWHSLLLLLVAYAEPAGVVAGGRSTDAVEGPAILTVVALWLTALGTGAFAALSERELRRQKVDLERLSAMLERIQLAKDADDVATILLSGVTDTFGFRAGAVFASPSGELTAIAAVGTEAPLGTRIDDLAVHEAIADRRVSAIAGLDERTDPDLRAIFGDARNLLVVPLLVERGRTLGVLVLERGGTQRTIRRWVVAMIEQFASHGALAMNSAWLAEERDTRMREIEELQSMLEAHNAHLEEIVDDRTRELRTAIADLEEVDRQRRRLLDHVVRAGEEERKRIAGDIHDDPVQKLVALKMRLELLSKEYPHLDEIAEGTRWVATAINSLRHLLFDLRPPVLDEEGLAAALRSFLENADVDFTWEVDDELERQPSSQTRLILYRIAQEALTNARKHSEAEHVRVRLSEENGDVAMEIADDGVGFEPRAGLVAAPGHMGLAAIRERAEMAGGRCELHSLPGQGTTFEVWLPLSETGGNGHERREDPTAFALLPGEVGSGSRTPNGNGTEPDRDRSPRSIVA